MSASPASSATDRASRTRSRRRPGPSDDTCAVDPGAQSNSPSSAPELARCRGYRSLEPRPSRTTSASVATARRVRFGAATEEPARASTRARAIRLHVVRRAALFPIRRGFGSAGSGPRAYSRQAGRLETCPTSRPPIRHDRNGDSPAQTHRRCARVGVRRSLRKSSACERCTMVGVSSTPISRASCPRVTPPP